MGKGRRDASDRARVAREISSEIETADDWQLLPSRPIGFQSAIRELRHCHVQDHVASRSWDSDHQRVISKPRLF
jgi:hypothetical protein